MNLPETRYSLIVKLQQTENASAWQEFVSAYEPFLRRLIQRQGVPERHVPDVTQQVLASIAHSVSQWQDDGNPASFRRWTHRVARNAVIKFMSRERRQIGGQGGTAWIEKLEQIAEPTRDADRRQYEHELIVWAADQVRHEFRPTSWQAFWATLVEGRSVNEVADALGVTPGSIYMSRSRIVARIRAKIVEILDE